MTPWDSFVLGLYRDPVSWASVLCLGASFGFWRAAWKERPRPRHRP